MTRSRPGSLSPNVSRYSAFSCARQLRNFRLDCSGYDNRLRPFGHRHLSDGSRMLIAFGGVFFLDVAGIEHRLCGQQIELAKNHPLPGRHLNGPGRLAFAQSDQDRFHDREPLLRFFLTLACTLFDRIYLTLYTLQVSQQQFGHHRLCIPNRVD